MPQSPGPRIDRLRQSVIVFRQRREALLLRAREQVASYRAAVAAEATELARKAAALEKTIALWERAERPRKEKRETGDLEHTPGDHGAELAAALGEPEAAAPAVPDAKPRRRKGRPAKKKR